MRKTWKEAGLILINLLIVASLIVGAELWLQKHFRAGLAPVAIVVCLGTYLAACRWIERRTPAELALPYALPELGIGMLGGLGLFSLTMAILWACGVYHPVGLGGLGHLGGGFVPALLGGIIEEILFRGLLFRLIAKVLGTWGALALTAAFFGCRPPGESRRDCGQHGGDCAGGGSAVGSGIRGDETIMAADRTALRVEFHRGLDFRHDAFRKPDGFWRDSWFAERSANSHGRGVWARSIDRRRCCLPRGSDLPDLSHREAASCRAALWSESAPQIAAAQD